MTMSEITTSKKTMDWALNTPAIYRLNRLIAVKDITRFPHPPRTPQVITNPS